MSMLLFDVVPVIDEKKIVKQELTRYLERETEREKERVTALLK